MKKTKKIAILGPIGIAMPPRKQGGIEWMVHYLSEGLKQNGWPLLLFAPKTTKTKVKLVPVCEKPIAEYKLGKEAEASRRLRMELSILKNTKIEILKRKKQIDLVFNHMVEGGLFADLEKELGVPVYHVLHLPLYQELAQIYQKTKAKLISISNNQRKRFPRLNYRATIYNGIAVEQFLFSKKAGDYFLFAGKMRKSKNPLDAIKAAKIAKEKLILVGKISDREYFLKKIKPRLNKKIVHLGEVSFSQIKKLYSKAKALLVPINWEEPFGLVMIESMASGTPVIAFNKGSVPEVIKDKETGFVVNNVRSMARAMKQVDMIKRENCRKHVIDNFSHEKMIKEYEKICLK